MEKIKKLIKIKHDQGKIELSKICHACNNYGLSTWGASMYYNYEEYLHDEIYLTDLDEGMEDIKDILNAINKEGDLTCEILEEDKVKNYKKIKITEWKLIVECYNI